MNEGLHGPPLALINNQNGGRAAAPRHKGGVEWSRPVPSLPAPWQRCMLRHDTASLAGRVMPECNKKMKPAVEEYLDDLGKIRASGGGTAEASCYPPLTNLLNAAGTSLTPPL